MSEVRRDKRTVRRVGPRRVGTGMVALLALGTGAGCGQSLLRPNAGAGIAAESLGQADMAIPSRRLAWVGSDGRRDLPLTAAVPPREPDHLNAGLEPAVVASATTWNGWKVPSSRKSGESEPIPPTDKAPLVEVTEPVAAAHAASIPMPMTRLAGNDPEVESLLAASRETKIAPPLKHRVARPAISVAPASTTAPIAVVEGVPDSVSDTSALKAEVKKSVATSPEIVALVNSSAAGIAVEPIQPSDTKSATVAPIPIAETKPVPAPTAPAPVEVEIPQAVMVTQNQPPVTDREADKPVAMAPLDPSPKPETVASAPVEAPMAGLSTLEPEAVTPIPPPSDMDPLALAAQNTGIPLPKRPADTEVAQVQVTEPTTVKPSEATVAEDSQPTDIPMPVPLKTAMPAPSVPVITAIPMPIPPVTVDYGTTKGAMPLSREIAPTDERLANAARTTNIPMPIPPVQALANAPLTVDYGTTNIPLPVPPGTVPMEDPLAAASRATNIPMPVSVGIHQEERLSEASRTTNIPMPVPISKPASEADPLVEADRTSQIPLPIPRSDRN